MEPNRKPTKKEKETIKFLIKKSDINFSEDYLDNLLVRPMSDGNMGSLKIFPYGKITDNRMFGKEISNYTFKDKDGVDVIVSLYIDTFENLFELDVWKTDYSPLINFPSGLLME